jgi:hypothetical protein
MNAVFKKARVICSVKDDIISYLFGTGGGATELRKIGVKMLKSKMGSFGD